MDLVTYNLVMLEKGSAPMNNRDEVGLATLSIFLHDDVAQANINFLWMSTSSRIFIQSQIDLL